MSSYNKIILVGNLTRDIEIRYTQGGSAIGNTGIAVTKKFKSQNGEQKEKTLFVDLTFFGRSAEIANQYLRKGSKVLIDGELQLDQWEKDGQKRSKHSIHVQNMQMLDSKSDTQAPQQSHQSTQGYQAPPSKPTPSSVPEIDIDSDEIPF